MTSDVFQTVILAGGLATRLRPMTETLPKSLVDVNGEPFIVHQLRLLQQNGIRDIVLCVGYLGDRIREAVGDGKAYGVNLIYSFDGAHLLGTAGAIKQAMPLLQDSFFVLYGDSYLPCDYASVQAAFTTSNKLALMTVFRNEGQWDTSNVEFNQGNVLAYDKKNRTERMRYIDYGLGVFNKQAFDHVPPSEAYDLACLYQHLLKQQQLAAFEVQERFYEAGSFAGIEELGYYLSSCEKA
jgi:NDP-sugar pyrophosphorylase family protein